MMSNKIFVLFLVLFLLPLATAATNVTTSTDVYSTSATVTIRGSCTSSDTAVGIEVGLGTNKVFLSELTTDDDKLFEIKFKPTDKGDYVVFAACDNDVSSSTKFCVGTAAECLKTPAPAPAPSSSSSSGGGKTCIPKWVESEWSICSPQGKQTMTKTSYNCPNTKPVTESRDCICQESWTCRANDGFNNWDVCQGGSQTRTCTDEHYCNTVTKKPAEKRSCSVEGSNAQPGDSDYSPPSKDQPELQEPSFFDQYLLFIIGGGAGLFILIIVLVIVLLGKKKSHHLVYQHEDLRKWIDDEINMGTSQKDIKQILSQNTGWSHDDLEEAFQELQEEEDKFGPGLAAEPAQQPVPVEPQSLPQQPLQQPPQ